MVAISFLKVPYVCPIFTWTAHDDDFKDVIYFVILKLYHKQVRF